jgi:hypothetical protein
MKKLILFLAIITSSFAEIGEVLSEVSIKTENVLIPNIFQVIDDGLELLNELQKSALS